MTNQWRYMFTWFSCYVMHDSFTFKYTCIHKIHKMTTYGIMLSSSFLWNSLAIEGHKAECNGMWNIRQTMEHWARNWASFDWQVVEDKAKIMWRSNDLKLTLEHPTRINDQSYNHLYIYMSYSRMFSSRLSYCIYGHTYTCMCVCCLMHIIYTLCKQIFILKAVAALHKLPVAPIKYTYGCIMCVVTFSSPYCCEHS